MENKNITITYVMDVLKAGFKRFYYEGSNKWSKQHINGIIRDVLKCRDKDMSNPKVQEILKEWEKAGFIRIIGEEDRYLEVINPDFDKV
jgi:hypothetical protein